MDSYEEIIADNRSKEINPVLFGWHKIRRATASDRLYAHTGYCITLLKAKAFLYATAKHII